MATGKQRRRVEKNGDGEVLIERLRSKEKPRRDLSHASVKPRVATGVTGSQEKHADGDSCPRLLYNVFTELPFI